MFTFIVGVIVGALVGWNFPQPSWVKKMTQKAKNEVDKL